MSHATILSRCQRPVLRDGMIYTDDATVIVRVDQQLLAGQAVERRFHFITIVKYRFK